MTTVNSQVPTNLFVATPSLLVNTIEGGKFDLNPGQMLRAIVVSRELDQVVLEIDRQLYLAKGERELQVGQKVDLQVVQTQPTLEFKVLTHPFSDRLSQSLPLLTRPFDWSQLLSQLQKPLAQGLGSAVPVKIYGQLQQILGATPELPAQFNEQIANIVSQLQQLSASGETVLENPLSLLQTLPQPGIQNIQPHVPAPSELNQTVMRLVKNLQNQLSLLPKEGEASLPKSWYVATRNLLAPLQKSPQMPLPLASQRQLLVTVLKQVQQHPKVSPQLSGEVKRVLVQINRQGAQDITAPAIEIDPAIVKNPAAVTPQPVGSTSEPADKMVEPKEVEKLVSLSTEIKQLLTQVRQGQEKKQGIAPELLGRLEGLLSRLQRLPQASSLSIPGFEVMVNQLEQLVAQRLTLPQGEQLGVLSQLFGFHLESELLQGKKRDALDSLKLSLLTLQKDLGDKVKEPLHRIELFQLCKAKLAEEQVAFLPLPFTELEEGYLLAERQSYGDEGNAKDDSPLQMSLSLRLSALGNLRIDMLYEKEGLHLRLACEDRGKMEYLQGCADELKESLEAIKLQGVSFSADARLPARQLQERLLPDSSNMLDERL